MIDKQKRIQELTSEDLANKDIFFDAMRKAYSQGEIIHLLKNSPIDFLTPYIDNLIKQDLLAIDDIPEVFLDDYEVAALYVKQDATNMVMLPEKFKDDLDFISEAIIYDGEVLEYASERIKNIESICLRALKNNPKAFKYLPEKFKTKENCLLALELKHSTIDFSINWKYIPSSLSMNEGFIKEAGIVCPKVYRYIDDKIKENIEITEYFVNLYISNLKYAPVEHTNNKDLVSPLIIKSPYNFIFVGDELKNDKNFILPILEKTPQLLYDCGAEIKNNKEVAKYICNIRTSRPPIEFFNDEIRSDVQIAMISVLRMPESMNCIAKTLSSSYQFVSDYIDQNQFNPVALHYISKELKNDVSLMKKAYDVNPNSIHYMDKSLKYNDDLLNHLFSIKNTNILLEVIKHFNLVKGDERVLLSLCNNSGLDINNYQVKRDVLRCIDNNEFRNLLSQEKDIYQYLKSTALFNKLNNDLTEPKEIVKKLKI